MYLITREELVKLIKKENNVGFKRILENHLRIMDGGVAVCEPCSIDDEPVEVVEEVKELEDGVQLSTEEDAG